jgi:site-specific recombinase XerD
MDRGSWIDPRRGDIALQEWCETFLSLARSLAPTTQETYRRDIERFVLPALGGARRVSQLRAEEIERWLNDELAAGSPRRRSTATTGRCAVCCRPRWRRTGC